MVNVNNVDIVSLSETWFNNRTTDGSIYLSGYQQPFRKDRSDRNGGGVAIYCANNIPSQRRPDLENTNIECIWMECIFNNKKLFFAVYYRTPGQTVDERDIFLSSLDSSIDLAFEKGADYLIITGDFNDRCQSWQDSHAGSELGLRLQNLVQLKGLVQLVNQPTRVSHDGEPKM